MAVLNVIPFVSRLAGNWLALPIWYWLFVSPFVRLWKINRFGKNRLSETSFRTWETRDQASE